MDEKNNDVVEILKSYDYDSWKKWITDITEHGIAYPISNLSANGDVLVEIIDFLRKNTISVFTYERALADCFAKEYKQNINNYILQERYLNALVYLSSDSCVKTLVQFLNSKVNSHWKGKTAYIKTLVVLTLSKTPVMEKRVAKEVFDYIQHRGIYEMTHDVYFYSTALRFCYRQVSIESFFKLISKILRLEFAAQERERIIYLIVDKIDELYYNKPSVLSKQVKNWLVRDFGYEQEISLIQIPMARELLLKVSELYQTGEIKVALNPNQSKEIPFEELTVEFFLSILLNEDVSAQGIMKDDYQMIDILEAMIADKQIMKFCSSIVKNNLDYLNNLSKTTFGIIPYTLKKEYQGRESCRKISSMFDRVVYDPANEFRKTSEGILSQIANA